MNKETFLKDLLILNSEKYTFDFSLMYSNTCIEFVNLIKDTDDIFFEELLYILSNYSYLEKILLLDSLCIAKQRYQFAEERGFKKSNENNHYRILNQKKNKNYDISTPLEILKGIQFQMEKIGIDEKDILNIINLLENSEYKERTKTPKITSKIKTRLEKIQENLSKNY